MRWDPAAAFGAEAFAAVRLVATFALLAAAATTGAIALELDGTALSVAATLLLLPAATSSQWLPTPRARRSRSPAPVERRAAGQAVQGGDK